MAMTADPDDMVHTIDDDVAAAGALVIRYGDQTRAAQRLAADRSLEYDDALDHVGEAIVRLVATAPPEVRQHFPTVCSWHRYQSMYESAERVRDVDNMMAAQKAMDLILARVH